MSISYSERKTFPATFLPGPVRPLPEGSEDNFSCAKYLECVLRTLYILYSKENKKNFVKKDKYIDNLPFPQSQLSWCICRSFSFESNSISLQEYKDSMLIHIPLLQDPIVTGCV